MNNWIAGNRYLNEQEMQHNAQIIYSILTSNGWTINSISALLGNMESESNINPGIWENLTEFSGGYGLVQWTPYTKYSEWAGVGWENNGDKECERIQYEVDNNIQWFGNQYAPITTPPLSFYEFTQSTESVGTLASYFLWYYEHASNTDPTERISQAEKWYTFLTGVTPTPTPTNKSKLPLYYYLRRM